MMKAIGKCLRIAPRALSSFSSSRSLSSIVTIPSEKHPWIAEVPGPKSFLPEERILTFLAANVAAGNIANVEQDWKHLPESHHAQGLEIVLQVHTLAGFPRSINALIKIEALGISPTASDNFEESYDVAKWEKDGKETLDTVYGSVTEKMLRNFKKMHPLLELILVEHIYGRMLSRPVVGLRIRELSTLAITAGMNLPVQVVKSYFSLEISSFLTHRIVQLSHLRGSLRCGATRDEVYTVIEQTHLAWGAAALTKARHIRDQKWSKWASAECEIEQ